MPASRHGHTHPIPVNAGFASTSSGWRTPSATPIAASRCAPTSPGCACRGIGRASSRWRPGSIPGTCARGTSRCIISSPMRRGTATARPARGPGLGARADGPPRPGGRVDRGRHRLPQEGPALGRGGPPVLRRAGQTGELPGGRERVAGERRGQSPGGLSAVSAGELGAGPAPASRGGRARTRSSSSRSGSSPSRRFGRCRRRGCRRRRSWRMPATATRPTFGRP